jgi:anti-sigma B factor antagonist
MRIQERKVGDVIILDVSGRITIGEGDVQLRSKIHELFEQGHRKILLNLGEVSYMDSAGIGELVAAYTAARNRGCELKLLNLTKKVQDLLTITHLMTVFEVYKDESEALRSFSP